MTKPRTEEPTWASWDFWRDAMKGKVAKVPLGIVSRGFYASQNRSTGIWYPVAIWIDDEGTPNAHKVAQQGMGQKVELDTAEAEHDYDTTRFSWSSRNPVAYEAYEHWMEHREWPEGHPYRPVTVPAARTVAAGDNSAPADPDQQASDEFRDQVDSALARLKDFEKLDGQEAADNAQVLRSRLSELAGEGERQHETAKKPWLEGGRKVDAAWNPPIKAARDGAKTLKGRIDTWGAAEIQKRQKEAAAAAEAGDAAAAVVKPVTVGRADIGRMAKIRTTTVPVIVDQDEVYRQFRTNPEVVALLEKLVRKVHAAGAQMKGVEYRPKDQLT